MKHCYLLFLITVILLFIGCNKQAGDKADNQPEFYTINFEQSFNTEKQMFISEIADTIEYIELKTPEDLVIANIWDVKQIGDYLIVRARLDAYIFRKNGQFVRQIGSRGQGPNEYTLAYKTEIDRKMSEIVIVDIERLLFYDLDGNFLRSKKKKDVSHIGISDTVLWIGDIVDSANSRYKAVAISLQGDGDTLAHISNPLYKIIKSTKKQKSTSPFMSMFYYKNNSLYFKGDMSNDTIWKISGVHADPYAFINMGKYKMPVEFEPWYTSDETYWQNCDKYWCVPSLVEDGRYFFLLSDNRGSTKYNSEMRYIVHDKKKEIGFVAKDDNDMGLIDDILGGPAFWPRWSSDEYYINTVTVHELLEKVETDRYTLSTPLKELFSRINDDSNDLVILCRRKK